MIIRSAHVSALAVVGMALCVNGCVRTVSFRADPVANKTSRLSCLQSSSGVCSFKVADGAAHANAAYRVAVGHSVSIDVPVSGVKVRGCVANKSFPSCSTLHIAPTTIATTGAKGW